MKEYILHCSEHLSILIQVRTGHCRLNKSLFKKNLRGSARCGCGRGDGTIERVLLLCPNWNGEWVYLCESVGDRCNDVPFLLGGYETKRDGQSDRMLDGHRGKPQPDTYVVEAAIEFPRRTRQLECSHTLEEREEFKERLECITILTGA
jgi:hypothetical protein